MTNPRMAPCPNCDHTKYMSVYCYDHGWKYVECDECGYRGPGEGSIRQAVISHNEAMLKR